jgi:hypothetical protein
MGIENHEANMRTGLQSKTLRCPKCHGLGGCLIANPKCPFCNGDGQYSVPSGAGHEQSVYGCTDAVARRDCSCRSWVICEHCLGIDAKGLVARIAYRYWENRGKPYGSAEGDWFRAEQELESI